MEQVVIAVSSGVAEVACSTPGVKVVFVDLDVLRENGISPDDRLQYWIDKAKADYADALGDERIREK